MQTLTISYIACLFSVSRCIFLPLRWINVHTYCVWKKQATCFLCISKNCVPFFLIFGVHHPDRSRNCVIKYFACILTTGVRSDDVTVTSVKMLFTKEDKHVINDLHKDKQYSLGVYWKTFPTKSGLGVVQIPHCKKLTMLVRLVVALAAVGRALWEWLTTWTP